MNQNITLKDVCELVVDCEHKTAPTQSTGYPSIRTPNIGRGRLILDNVNRVSEDTYKAWTKRAIPQSGDLILAREAPIGNVAIIPQNLKVCLGQRTVLIRADNNKIDSHYLCYLLLGDEIQGKILGLSNGATVHHLNMRDIRNLELPKLPPLPTQIKIASILSAYDDLIENNTKRIKILEEMAQFLYHEWFVKFRFPGHEQVKMVESELGLIPEGWNVKKLEQLGLLARGKSKHRPRNDPSLFGGNYPFIQTGEVKEAFLYITNYTQTYNDNGLAQSKLWEGDTLLITIAANIAETAILNFRACFPDSIVGFVPDTNLVSAEFIKYSIDTIKIRMQNVSKGTTQDNLSLEKIKIFNFLLPEQKIMQLFINMTTPLFLQIKNLLLKNQNLRKTRDLLLPKLISGEIDLEKLNIDRLDIAA
ncbi:restriction endonuclease subunit S [Aulosira sp. FACHB-615]|uniref:restriction endonuclease subunit S n=1 Tax=Aulosira sp. FACHB-615 TaxID=2692777 RepID=UPI001683CBD4|nr:restriction endonuclease subunit S [Aulosira sp. FACHB-615]MBD2490384.1 restriction endonuclease subunit S [Aulosira sp. FACHB-615]